MTRLLFLLISVFLTLTSFTQTSEKTAMVLSSPVFQENGFIPQKYTCDSVNVSPPLNWNTIPAGTVSFVLICEDPDAPDKTFVHWVLYNIPPSLISLPEKFSPSSSMVTGLNDFGKSGYSGPCPPSGTHRYIFKLIAVDIKVETTEALTKEGLYAIISNHFIAEATLMGKYSK